jgi:cell division protein FtsQ
MPPEMDDPEDEDEPVRLVKRFSPPRKPWWRPASSVGRFFLAFAALIVLGSLGTSAYLLKAYLDRDGRFRIDGAGNIEAAGLSEVSRAEMLPVFGEDIGRNIFFVPLSERRKQLEQIPWIEKATVMRLLPNQIRITVVERQPVAFTRIGSQIGLVDANGVLLTMPAAMMAQHHYSFPTVSGIDAGDPPATRKGRMQVYLHLLGEFDSGGQRLSAQISEIDLTDPADARVTMQDDTTLLHFGEDHFLERYQRYKSHINEWRQQYPNLAAVDLRYDQKVVLQMASDADLAKAAAGEQSEAGAEPDKPSTAKPADAAPGSSSSGKKDAGGKPALTAHAATDKAPAKASLKASVKKPAAKARLVKTSVKAGKKTSAKLSKKTSVKTKAAPKTNLGRAALKTAKSKPGEKNHAELKHAALNVNRQKTASTTPPVESSGQGQ